MIHCLHGGVGHPGAWDIFDDKLGEKLHKVDIWSLLTGPQTDLQKSGAKIAQQAKRGDILLGYSMGGRLALNALLADREKWGAVILVSTNPGLTKGHDKRRANDELWARLAEKNWSHFMKQWNALEIFNRDIPLDPGFRQATEYHKYQVARSFREWSVANQHDIRPAYPGFGCPILWVTGVKDDKYCFIAEEAVRKLRRGRHVHIPNAAHRAPWEQPQLFAQVVRDFLSSVKSNPEPVS